MKKMRFGRKLKSFFNGDLFFVLIIIAVLLTLQIIIMLMIKIASMKGLN